MAQANETIKKQIVLIGAGPCGLGASWRLHELNFIGEDIDWMVIDAAPNAGGLAQTVKDDKGFYWDIGVHVTFSHYAYYTKLMDHLVDEYNHRQREAWTRMRGVWIPYPVQNNIHRLPHDELLKCLLGLVDVEKERGSFKKPINFAEWMLQAFGKGLCDSFMFPYNYRVWAHPPEMMNTEWMGERVATVNLEKILSNVLTRQDELGWGPNATFRYPKYGGIGSIWSSLYEKLPANRKHLNTKVIEIDVHSKLITLENGGKIQYENIVSTMPLSHLITIIKNHPTMTPNIALNWSSQFKYSTTHIIGIAIQGATPKELTDKGWVYLPEDIGPVYRACFLSNFSAHTCAEPENQWSILCEVSQSPYKPIDDETSLVQQTIDGLIRVGIMQKQHSDAIVSTFYRKMHHGYPTPFLGRDQLLNQVQPELEKMGIYSRGRFGGWKYEVANQDHSFMQGVEAIDHVLFGTEETTYHFPSVVNAFKDGGNRLPKIEALKWSI